MEDKNIFDCQEHVIQMMFYNKEVSMNTGINVCPQGDKGGFMNTCASTLEITIEWNEKFLPRETRFDSCCNFWGKVAYWATAHDSRKVGVQPHPSLLLVTFIFWKDDFLLLLVTVPLLC